VFYKNGYETMNAQIPDIGEIIPGFSVPDSDGNRFELKEALNDTTYLMLVFYRGHW
jgi:hypothetical protein